MKHPEDYSKIYLFLEPKWLRAALDSVVREPVKEVSVRHLPE
jgi:hypothetical protein